MNRNAPHDHVATTLPIALAIALPWGAFSREPLLGLPLGGLFLIVMTVATLLRWHRDRTARPPFEYWWPGAAALAGAVYLFSAGHGPLARHLVYSCAAFLTPLALAANGSVATRTITVFGATTGIVALIQWGAELSWIPPTVVAVPVNMLMAGPDSLSSGILLMLEGAVACAVALLHPAFHRGQRQVAAVALMPLVIWFVVYLLPRSGPLLAAWHPTPFHALPGLHVVLIAIALWLNARIAARALLLSRNPGGIGRVAFPVALGLLATTHLLVGVMPGTGTFFLLGLAAALDTPWTKSPPAQLFHPIWAIPVLCIAVQLAGLTTLSSQDPRNQRARGERLLDNESWAELNGMLSCLLARQADHPDYTLLQARALLAQGWPAAAVATYGVAPRSIPGATPFQERHQQMFLDALRDATSAQPRGHANFHFERALLHGGDWEQVQDLLQIRRGAARAVEDVVLAPALLCQALESSLGAPRDALSWDGWNADELMAVLQDSGVSVRAYPQAMNPDMAPCFVEGRIAPDALHVTQTFLGDSRETTVHFVSRARSLDPHRSAAALAWDSWRAESEGTWALDLRDGATPLATVLVGNKTELATPAPVLPTGAESSDAVLWVP